jgi:DNA-binding XRE family transcriptional regulator
MSARVGYRQPRGERLRERRRELALTQAAVATAAGVRPQEVAKYEKGEIPAAPDKARGIARALAITIDVVFEPPAVSEKAAALMTAAGRCGSPRCSDPKCTIPSGQCHAVDCTEPAKLATDTNTWAREVAGQPRMFCTNECAMRTIGKTTKGSPKEYWTTSEGQAVLAQMGDERRRRVEVKCAICSRPVDRVLSKANAARQAKRRVFCPTCFPIWSVGLLRAWHVVADADPDDFSDDDRAYRVLVTAWQHGAATQAQLLAVWPRKLGRRPPIASDIAIEVMHQRGFHAARTANFASTAIARGDVPRIPGAPRFDEAYVRDRLKHAGKHHRRGRAAYRHEGVAFSP